MLTAGGASFAVLVLLVWWATRTEFGVLYAGMEPADAGVVIEQLKEENIPYKLENGGTTILVPRDKVYDLRLRLASQGLPQSGLVGYEIFDRNNIGTTDFIQKINYRRALEGELARTISTMKEIKAARVHLVIPEPRLFEEQQKEATASVTVKLGTGHTLSRKQTLAIANLVAASVEGLRPENVTIVDTDGNILNQPRESETFLSMTADQIELKRKVEEYYNQKLTRLLENVVGKGKVAVQVTADLNFDRVERTIEKYDPDNLVVISQERSVEEGTGESGGTSQKVEHTITNYEVNKTIERIVQDVGNIKRITVAVMVDGKYQLPPNAGKDATPTYVPRSEEELQNLREAVKTAIGYDEKRGDQIQVVNMPFDRTHLIAEEKAMRRMERQMFWQQMLKRFFLLLLVLGIGYGLWKIIGSFKTYFVPHTAPVLALETGEEGPMNLELPPEIKNNVRLQQTIATLTREKPDDAAKLLKAWLIEDEHERV